MKPARRHLHGSALHTCYGRSVAPMPRLIERRRHERFVLLEPVTIRTCYSELIGNIVEISNSGCALEISSGFTPGIGTEMALTLRDNKHLWSSVRRVDGNVVAVEFPLDFNEIDCLIQLEQRGMDVYAGRQRW